MARKTGWIRRAGVVLALASSVPSVQAATLVAYPDDRAGFVANTGAASIGNLPSTGAVASRTVGGVTFTTDSGSLWFGDFSTRVPNNEMIVSGAENFHMTIPGGVYSLGLDIFEPTFTDASGCNTACVNTNFTIQVFAGATSLGLFPYNAPDDNGTGPVVLGFFGVHSDVLFDRVVVRDVTGNSDNEMFANVLTGTLPLVPTPAAGRSWGRLKSIYR